MDRRFITLKNDVGVHYSPDEKWMNYGSHITLLEYLYGGTHLDVTPEIAAEV